MTCHLLLWERMVLKMKHSEKAVWSGFLEAWILNMGKSRQVRSSGCLLEIRNSKSKMATAVQLPCRTGSADMFVMKALWIFKAMVEVFFCVWASGPQDDPYHQYFLGNLVSFYKIWVLVLLDCFFLQYTWFSFFLLFLLKFGLWDRVFFCL